MHREEEDGEEVPFFPGLHKYKPAFELKELFSIYGTGYSQVLEISIPPDYVVSSKPGTLLHTSPDLTLNLDTGGIGQAVSRALSGGSVFRLNAHNRTTTNQTIALASGTPGSIIPLDLRTLPNSSFTFSTGAFVAAMGMDWGIGLRTAPTISTAFCGGQGVLLNEIRGNTIVWLKGCGSILEKILQPNETIVVDTRCVIGFDTTVRFEVGTLGDDCATCCFGGAGWFNTHLTGPGKVLIQSFPIQKLALYVPQKNDN